MVWDKDGMGGMMSKGGDGVGSSRLWRVLCGGMDIGCGLLVNSHASCPCD